MLTTRSLIDAYNAKVSSMQPDPKCQHPEAGPAFRDVDYCDVHVNAEGNLELLGEWRVHELLLLAETARELQTMGLGEVQVEVQGGGQ